MKYQGWTTPWTWVNWWPWILYIHNGGFVILGFEFFRDRR